VAPRLDRRQNSGLSCFQFCQNPMASSRGIKHASEEPLSSKQRKEAQKSLALVGGTETFEIELGIKTLEDWYNVRNPFSKTTQFG
jgi:hypothetical protein